MSNTLEQLCNALDENRVRYRPNIPLSEYTTFAVGGATPLLIEPVSEGQIAAVISASSRLGVPYYVIGNGSNLLVDDAGVDFPIIHLGKNFSSIAVSEAGLLCQSGANIIDASAFAMAHELSGLEFAYGIPGTVGGAVYMNAGAYGGQIENIVNWVTAVDTTGKLVRFEASELDFSYRHSVFKDSGMCVTTVSMELARGDGEAIKAASYKNMELREQKQPLELASAGSTFKRPEGALTVSMELARGDGEAIKAASYKNMELREQKQPLELASAGSTFKRPEGAFAGALIEQCGLKGFRIGRAGVSEKHAGFVVNYGGASCADVLAVIHHVQDTVKAQTGYFLDTEVIYLH